MSRRKGANVVVTARQCRGNHEKMIRKFIKKCKEDGAVECVVITGDDERAMGAFADHGKIVFEMFYRVDLSTMGA